MLYKEIAHKTDHPQCLFCDIADGNKSLSSRYSLFCPSRLIAHSLFLCKIFAQLDASFFGQTLDKARIVVRTDKKDVPFIRYQISVQTTTDGGFLRRHHHEIVLTVGEFHVSSTYHSITINVFINNVVELGPATNICPAETALHHIDILILIQDNEVYTAV